MARNYQGIWSTLIVKALKELERVYESQFLFFSETKNKKEKLEVIRRKLKFEESCYVESEGLSRGLAV